MANDADNANVVVRPPVAWAIAAFAGWVLDRLVPSPFLPYSVPAGWIGGIVFALALALFGWAVTTMKRSGSNVETSHPTTTIVDVGPYGATRNPIYLAMVLSLAGLGIAFNSLWSLLTLVLFALLIHFGVIAREEAYLARKFGEPYLQYRARVRRWI